VSRQLLLTVLVFVVALGSGTVIGWNVPRHSNSPRPQERSWLADELKLTPEQRERMKSIWSAMLPEGQGRQGERGPGRHDARRQLIRERDEGIAALIPVEKKADYEKVLARFEQQEEELSREREKALAKAVEQTKLILNPEQRVKYEELLKKGSFGSHRPGTNPSSTQPVVK
jgi:Spy/CpxP family protein refolding chaperone